MNIASGSLLAFLFAASAAAQCPFSAVVAQSVGPWCNLGPTGCCAIAEQPTILAPALDVTACALDFEVRALEGCCGVAVPVRLLAIGVGPVTIPIPQFGPSCALGVVPAAILVQQGPTFRIAIPPTLQPFTFHAQACAVITNTLIPTPTVVTLTETLAITLL